MISLKDLQKMVHQTAREKGWWPFVEDKEYNELTNKISLQEVNIPEKLILIVSELVEALEFYREDVGMHGPVWKLDATGQWITEEDRNKSQTFSDYIKDGNKKPDGMWVELADCIIRILDLAGAYDIDMEALVKLKHEYNKTRPFRHGNKKC